MDGEDTFLVGFQGALFECASLNDALALKAAEFILGDCVSCDETPGELDRIVEVLHRYGLTEPARQLASLSARLRARRYLIATVHYEPPAKSSWARSQPNFELQ